MLKKIRYKKNEFLNYFCRNSYKKFENQIWQDLKNDILSLDIDLEYLLVFSSFLTLERTMLSKIVSKSLSII